MIIVEQGKIVEVCAEPGEYIYNTSREPSIFSRSLGTSIKEIFKTICKRFTYGGDTGKDQREYYFNDNIIYFPQRKESEILFAEISYKTVIDIIIETCIEIGEKELKNRLTKTGTPWYINYSTFSDGCSKTNKIPIKEIINYMERD